MLRKHHVRAAAAHIGYPVVAKPVDLNSGTSVRRADDEAALKDGSVVAPLGAAP